MSEKKEELQEKAVMMAELSATYSRDYPLYSPIFGGENQGIRIIAQVASSLSDIDFLIWDTQSNTLLTTDNRLEGQEVALPAKITDKVLAGGSYAGMTALNIYPSSKYVVAVPIYAVGTGDIQGMVLAVTEAQSLTGMWRGFLGIFAMTSITVLLIAFVASSITAMQQTRPIQEMAAAARRFAEGNFDARVQTTDRDLSLIHI